MNNDGLNKKDGDELKGLLDAIQEKAKKAKQTFNDVAQRSKDLAGAMQRVSQEMGKSGEGLMKLAGLSEKFLQSTDKTHKIQSELTAQVEERYQYELRLANTAEDRLQAQIKYNAELVNAKNAEDSLKSLAESQTKAQQDLLKLQIMKNTGLRGEALSAAASYQLMVQQGTLSKQQYAELVKELKEQQDITQELEDQVQMEQEIAAEILDIRDNTESWGKSLNKAWATSKAIANDPKAMGALTLQQLNKHGKKAVETFHGMRESGMSAGQAADASFKAFSLNAMMGLSDTKGAIAGLQEEFGAVSGFSSEVVDDIGHIAHEMGISGQEAGKMVAQTMKMTGATAEQATHQLEVTNQLAKQAGLNPGALTKEMAQNMGNMSRFTKGGVDAFAKIAIEAKKIGVELSTTVKMADSLLDFESSIEKQMEASVLLGKEINFDKARQLALEGKSVEAAKEMLNQVGGIEQFNSMNVVQQKALADSMGMSVEELQKAVNGQEAQNEAIGEGVDAENEMLFATLERGAAMISMAKEYGGFALSALQFGKSLMNGKAKEYAMDAAHWIKEKAQMAWRFMSGNKLAAQSAEAAKKGAGGALKGATAAKGAVGDTKALDAAGGGADKGKALSDKAGKVKKPGGFAAAMRSIRNGIQAFAVNPGKTLKGAATLAAAGVILAIGLAAIMGAMTVAGGPMEMIAAGVALVAFALSFKLMANALGKVPIGSVIKGALALVILGGALTVAAFAFSLLAGVDVGTIIAFSIALPLLALAAAGLGFLIVPIAIGAAALGILGLALIAVAGAMLMFASAEGGVQALQGFLTTFAENPAVGMAMLGTAMAMYVFSGALFALAIASFFGAPALIALGAGMFMLGLGVKFASEGLESISKSLPMIADGVGALGAVVPMLALASLFLMELGFASLIAAPGLLIGSFALGLLAATMGVFAAAVALAVPGVGLLIQLGSMSEAFAMIAESMWSMAAGITAFATAGLLTLPTIMGLIALSFVAPILTLLGDSINYDLGGGSSVQQAPEEDKMNVLIEEIRALRAAFQTPGTINMDGQKVGDVLGLAVSNSGVA